MDPGELRRTLIGTWVRSVEEETEGNLVFRPSEHDFPPARAPRPALRLEPDGTAVSLRGGPTDRHEADPGPNSNAGPNPSPGLGSGSGRWALDGSTLSLRTAQFAGDFILEALDPDRLVLKNIP